MRWHGIVRVGKDDEYSPVLDRDMPRFCVVFDNPDSQWRVSLDIVQRIKRVLKRDVPISSVDFLHFATAVYSADRCVRREYSENAWERSITLYVPVADPDKWNRAKDTLKNALDYLSGDNWEFVFRSMTRAEGVTVQNQQECLTSDVCLLSGGLDSLVGAIDLIEQGVPAYFVGHYGGGGVTSQAQSKVFGILQDQMSVTEKQCHNFSIVQPQIAGHKYEESMRTRSLLFLALGCALGCSCSDGNVNLHIPENGLISLNVSLTEARTGSLSTRTTHPCFIQLIQHALSLLELPIILKLPYRYKTKGEMLCECGNQQVLATAAPLTVSCSHPESSRWVRGAPPGIQCGRCLPCLVRRASMHKAHLLDANYVTDVLSSPPDPKSDSGRDFRAVMMALYRYESETRDHDYFRVQATGHIEIDQLPEYIGVYQRGMEELASWLTESIRE